MVVGLWNYGWIFFFFLLSILSYLSYPSVEVLVKEKQKQGERASAAGFKASSELEWKNFLTVVGGWWFCLLASGF